MKKEPQPKSLLEFYKDTDTKDNVHAYLIEFLKEQAIKELFEGNADSDAYTIALAKKVIDKAFDNLDYLFGGKVEKKEQINGAR
jgi:hypothetical protein